MRIYLRKSPLLAHWYHCDYPRRSPFFDLLAAVHFSVFCVSVTARVQWSPAVPLIVWPLRWAWRKRRWVRLRDGFLPVYLRVGFAGASLATLAKRKGYRGGRKARRAARRIDVWTRGAYVPEMYSAMLTFSMGALAVMSSWFLGAKKAA